MVKLNKYISSIAQKALSSESSPAEMKPTYFAALDGMRGIFAICVAIYHTFWFTNTNSHDFFNNGAVIIDLFFVFSGFLIFLLYHDRLDSAESARTFLKRRFARLYPLHAFMLGIMVAFSLARTAADFYGLSTRETGEILPFHAGAQENLWSLFANLTLTHAIGITDSLSFNYPSWTISAEVWAYALFLFVCLYVRPRHVRDYAILAMGVAVIYLGLSTLKPDLNITYDYGVWRCAAGFMTGVITGALFLALRSRISSYSKTTHNKTLRVPTASRRTIYICATAAEIVASVGFYLFIIYNSGQGQFFVAPVVAFLVLVFGFNAGAISAFIGQRFFLYLGKISYSIYMVHSIISIVFYMAIKKLFPVLQTSEGGWTGDLVLIPYLLVVILVSHLTYNFVERPGQKWLMSFSLYEKTHAFFNKPVKS